MDIHELYIKITDEYSAPILNWAIKKTGSRSAGEDLAQEVFLQVFIAAKKQDQIEKLENFIWKVAHFTWCNYTRTLVRNFAAELSETLPDGADFTLDYAENDALATELSRMRRKIADLSKLQRKVVVLHYLDGLPVREVAAQLNITETAAAWHLFDARKKVKKELETMKNESTYVYSPGKMSVKASAGMNLSDSGGVPKNPDTDKINDSLIRQNLCLLCRGNGKTIDELVEITGVPKPYLEYDLDWLAERELLLLDGKRYHTSFIIMNQKYFEYRKEVYSKYRDSFLKKVINYLWQNESKIRKIGFYGSDFPTERLMWAVITMFISYVSRNSELLLQLKSGDNREIHTDGGKYHVMAFDGSDGQYLDISGAYNDSGWENFLGIACDNFAPDGFERYYWLGVYNFANSDAWPEIFTGEEKTRAFLHKLYCKIIRDDFVVGSLDAEEKEKLAEAVKNGLVTKSGNSYKPNYVVFTKEQLAQLQNEIYAPLLSLIAADLEKLAKQFGKLHKADFPKAKQGNINHHTYLDLWMFGIFTLIFATEENKLYLPKTSADGTSLTLVLAK